MGEIKKPNDGGGIKWSTLRRKVRKVPLENGDELDLGAVTWEPFPNTGVVYVGYEVDLEREVMVGDRRVSKIQVWVLVSQTAKPIGDFKGWCHGLTFDDVIYSPGGSEVPAILAAGWTEIECATSQQGDIIVYYDANGAVSHTAISNGDGTYKSKGGFTRQNDRETDAAMSAMYRVPPGTKKCYRKNA